LTKTSLCDIVIWEEIMREKVEEVLAQLRPNLRADGGDIELINVEDGVVTVRLTGACEGCPMRSMTLTEGIERILKEQLPEVKEVVAV
jgi:Fe-S cluster biogenesis protein NfuA